MSDDLPDTVLEKLTELRQSLERRQIFAVIYEGFRKRQCLLNVCLAFGPAIKKRSSLDLIREFGVDSHNSNLEVFLLIMFCHLVEK